MNTDNFCKDVDIMKVLKENFLTGTLYPSQNMAFSLPPL